MKASHLSYRPEIDGLRAIAVTSVIFYHAGLSLFGGGFVGVDIFFVISGFLITAILINNLKNGNFSFLNFYERRARRILPALFVVLFVSTIFAWLSLIPYEFQFYSRALVSVILFISNTKFGQENNYFDPINELKPLTHTWSLAVEEQFYIFFPVLLIVLWKFQRNRILNILITLSLLSLIGAEIGSVVKPGENFYFTLTRSWELLIGAISALIIDRVPPNRYLPILGFLFITVAIFFYDSTTPTPSIFMLLPTMGAAFVILFSKADDLVTRLLAHKVPVFFGRISYSAYLWHYLLFSYYRMIFGVHVSLSEAAILIFFTFALAHLTWLYIEQPFRAGERTIVSNQRSIFVLSGTVSLLFLSFGIAGQVFHGFEFRLPIEQRDSVLFQDSESFKFARSTSNDSCEDLLNSPPLSEEVCITNSAIPKILIAGDSKAMSLYSAIYSKKSDMSAMLIAAHGCPLYANLNYLPTFETGFSNNCTAIAKKIIETANNLKSVDTVIIFNDANQLDEGLSRYDLEGKRLTKAEAFRSAYNFVLSDLSKSGKRIILVSDNPTWSVDPKKCLQTLPLSRPSHDGCQINVKNFRENRTYYFQVLNELKRSYPKVIFYDPLNILCNLDGSCDIHEHQKLLYFDKTHMSPLAALKVLNAIKEGGYIR
jgi:peptidoglycan/LPS O-acetylase OafA/YrhL